MFIPRHQHLIIDGIIENPIKKVGEGKRALLRLVDIIGMRAVTKPQCVYVRDEGNEGLTGSINLATSHIAFHIWDKKHRIAIDCYSCTSFCNDTVIREIGDLFGTAWIGYNAIEYNRDGLIKLLY